MNTARRRTDDGERTAPPPSALRLNLNSRLASRLLSTIGLGASLVLFLAIALHQLDLPGLYYDEALDLTPMLDVMRGAPTPLLRNIGLPAGGYTYPVMLMDYMGSLNGYLTLPFMAVLGSGVAAARLEPMLRSALPLLRAYAIARAWFGRAAGLLTALLLAVNPSFIWFSRQGITVTSVMTVFSLGSWLALDAWRRRRSKWLLVTGNSRAPARPPLYQLPITNYRLLLAGLLLGLGLWAKIIFVWWIALLGVMTLVWLLPRSPARPLLRTSAPPHPRSSAPRLLLRALPWVVIGFLVGAAPFLYFNLAGLAQGQTPATLNLLFKSLFEPTQYGINNSNLLANLDKRVQDFAVFLNGSYFWFLAPVPYGNVFAVPVFLVSAVVGSVLAIRRPEWRKWLALIACIAVYLPVSAFTVSDLWATHFFVLFPLPQMVVAVAAVWLAERMTGFVLLMRGITSHLVTLSPCLLVIGLLALPFARDLWVSEQYHTQLGVMGGSGRFSDAIYKLAAHLDAEHVAEPVALDWGIEKNVRVLTGDRVRPVEIFGFTPEPDETFNQRAREMLADPARQYIVLWDRFAVYNRRLAFTQIAESMGREVVETFIAHERSGLPVYVILQAR